MGPLLLVLYGTLLPALLIAAAAAPLLPSLSSPRQQDDPPLPPQLSALSTPKPQGMLLASQTASLKSVTRPEPPPLPPSSASSRSRRAPTLLLLSAAAAAHKRTHAPSGQLLPPLPAQREPFVPPAVSRQDSLGARLGTPSAGSRGKSRELLEAPDREAAAAGGQKHVEERAITAALQKAQGRLMQAWEAGRLGPQQELGLPAGTVERMAADGLLHLGASSAEALRRVFLRSLAAQAEGGLSGRRRGIRVVALGGSITAGYSGRATKVRRPWPTLLRGFLSAAFPLLRHSVANRAVRACGAICPALSLPAFVGTSPDIVILEFNINVGEAWDSRLLLEQLQGGPSPPALLNLNFFGCKPLFAPSGPARGGTGCDPWPTAAASEFTPLATQRGVTTLSLATALRPFWRPPSEPRCNSSAYALLTSGTCEANCTLPPGRCTTSLVYSTPCSDCIKRCYENAAGAEPGVPASRPLVACRLLGSSPYEISAETVLGEDQIHSSQLGHTLAGAVMVRHLLSIFLQITPQDVVEWVHRSQSQPQSASKAHAGRAESLMRGTALNGTPGGRATGACFSTAWGQYLRHRICSPLVAQKGRFPGWRALKLSVDKALLSCKQPNATFTFQATTKTGGWLAMLHLRAPNMGPAEVWASQNQATLLSEEPSTSGTSVVAGFIFPTRINVGRFQFRVTTVQRLNAPVGFGLIGLFILPSLRIQSR